MTKVRPWFQFSDAELDTIVHEMGLDGIDHVPEETCKLWIQNAVRAVLTDLMKRKGK